MNLTPSLGTFAVHSYGILELMGRKDPRVDAYIAKSADFAKPILEHLRSIVHEGCPDVEESL